MINMFNVTEVYDSSGTVALDGIDLQIEEGEFVFLVGPSGSGKTTLMKLITGEVRATDGTVVVNDFDMTKVYCDGAAGAEGELHSSFVLDREGRKLSLLSPRGTEVLSLKLPKVGQDSSL